MRERDLRQIACKDCKKRQRNELILIIAMLAGAGLFLGSAAMSHSFYLGCGVGLFFIALAYHVVNKFRKKHKKELDVIRQGILTEAEVVELREERNSDDQLKTMAVCEFTLPGGRKHRFKESTSSSMAGVLGLIRVGTRFPLFVDRNNPNHIHVVKPKLSGFNIQDLAQQPGIQGVDSPILDKYLQKPREIWDMPPDRNLARRGNLSLWIFYILMGIILAALVGGMVSSVYDNWRNNVRHDDIELPSGTYISLINTTKVYQYFPETNEWSYHLNEFGVTRTKNWRFDSKCREPLEISYTSWGHQDASDWPVLLIPESYRDRMDEFIKDGENTGTTPP